MVVIKVDLHMSWLLEFYEIHNSAVECQGASNSEVKQIMVEKPDPCDQLHVCKSSH
jgi:hypothetical protein